MTVSTAEGTNISESMGTFSVVQARAVNWMDSELLRWEAKGYAIFLVLQNSWKDPKMVAFLASENVAEIAKNFFWEDSDSVSPCDTRAIEIPEMNWHYVDGTTVCLEVCSDFALPRRGRISTVSSRAEMEEKSTSIGLAELGQNAAAHLHTRRLVSVPKLDLISTHCRGPGQSTSQNSAEPYASELPGYTIEVQLPDNQGLGQACHVRGYEMEERRQCQWEETKIKRPSIISMRRLPHYDNDL
ncbi:hypothetical protein K438DRAFT_1772587 [Mycena galopus ATCC 62051]|nr:hypothetical protein K438DRAFT_1772587 [Mycena galopus ATCC 62051]